MTEAGSHPDIRVRFVRRTGGLISAFTNRCPKQKHSIPKRMQKSDSEGSSGWHGPHFCVVHGHRAQCKVRQGTQDRSCTTDAKKKNSFCFPDEREGGFFP